MADESYQRTNEISKFIVEALKSISSCQIWRGHKVEVNYATVHPCTVRPVKWNGKDGLPTHRTVNTANAISYVNEGYHKPRHIHHWGEGKTLFRLLQTNKRDTEVDVKDRGQRTPKAQYCHTTPLHLITDNFIPLLFFADTFSYPPPSQSHICLLAQTHTHDLTTAPPIPQLLLPSPIS